MFTQVQFPPSVGFASDVVSHPTSQLSFQHLPQIPAHLGQLEFVHQGTKAMIFHIQEAHGNIQGQKNIRDLLKHLHQAYGVDTVFLEGDAFDLNANLLMDNRLSISHDSEALTQFLEARLLTGPEVFLMQHKGTQGLGIENLDLYLQGGKAFARVLSQKEKAKQYLEDLNLETERLRSAYLSSELNAFLKQSEAYEAQPQILGTYLQTLKMRAKKELGLDLDNPESQIKWPMLTRIFVLQTIDRQINVSKYESERESFLKVIRYFFSENQKQENAIYQSIVKHLRFIEGEFSWADPETEILFEAMAERLPPYFPFARYPNVGRVMGRELLQSELKSDPLMAEIKILQAMIVNQMASSSHEKDLITAMDQQKQLKKLFSLQLSANEVQAILKRPENFYPDSLRNRLLAIDHEHRFHPEMSKNMPEIESLIEDAISFYRISQSRDGVLIRNLEKRMHEKGLHKVAVITGGFHSKPFQKHFSSQDYGYALITPKMDNAEGWKEYSTAVFRMFSEISKPSFTVAQSTQRLTDFLDKTAFHAMGNERGWEQSARQMRFFARTSRVSLRPKTEKRSEVRQDTGGQDSGEESIQLHAGIRPENFVTWSTRAREKALLKVADIEHRRAVRFIHLGGTEISSAAMAQTEQKSSGLFHDRAAIQSKLGELGISASIRYVALPPSGNRHPKLFSNFDYYLEVLPEDEFMARAFVKALKAELASTEPKGSRLETGALSKVADHVFPVQVALRLANQLVQEKRFAHPSELPFIMDILLEIEKFGFVRDDFWKVMKWQSPHLNDSETQIIKNGIFVWAKQAGIPGTQKRFETNGALWVQTASRIAVEATNRMITKRRAILFPVLVLSIFAGFFGMAIAAVDLLVLLWSYRKTYFVRSDDNFRRISLKYAIESSRDVAETASIFSDAGFPVWKMSGPVEIQYANNQGPAQVIRYHLHLTSGNRAMLSDSYRKARKRFLELYQRPFDLQITFASESTLPRSEMRGINLSPNSSIELDALELHGHRLQRIPLTREILLSRTDEILKLLRLIPANVFWDEQKHLREIAANLEEFDPELSYVVKDEQDHFVAFSMVGQKKLDRALENSSHPFTASDRAIYLNFFSVHPDYQGSGVAEWLLYQSFEASKNKNISLVHWRTRRDTPQSLRFYHKMGARILAVTQPDQGADIPKIYHVELAGNLEVLLQRLKQSFKKKLKSPHRPIDLVPATGQPRDPELLALAIQNDFGNKSFTFLDLQKKGLASPQEQVAIAVYRRLVEEVENTASKKVTFRLTELGLKVAEAKRAQLSHWRPVHLYNLVTPRKTKRQTALQVSLQDRFKILKPALKAMPERAFNRANVTTLFGVKRLPDTLWQQALHSRSELRIQKNEARFQGIDLWQSFMIVVDRHWPVIRSLVLSSCVGLIFGWEYSAATLLVSLFHRWLNVVFNQAMPLSSNLKQTKLIYDQHVKTRQMINFAFWVHALAFFYFAASDVLTTLITALNVVYFIYKVFFGTTGLLQISTTEKAKDQIFQLYVWGIVALLGGPLFIAVEIFQTWVHEAGHFIPAYWINQRVLRKHHLQYLLTLTMIPSRVSLRGKDCFQLLVNDDLSISAGGPIATALLIFAGSVGSIFYGGDFFNYLWGTSLFTFISTILGRDGFQIYKNLRARDIIQNAFSIKADALELAPRMRGLNLRSFFRSEKIIYCVEPASGEKAPPNKSYKYHILFSHPPDWKEEIKIVLEGSFEQEGIYKGKRYWLYRITNFPQEHLSYLDEREREAGSGSNASAPIPSNPARQEVRARSDAEHAAQGVYQTVMEIYEHPPMQVLVNPAPSGHLHRDHSIMTNFWNGKPVQMGLGGESPEGIPAVNLPWETHEANIDPELARRGPVHIYSLHNLYFNDWFIIYDGKLRRLFYGADEPVTDRVYTMFVSWKNSKQKYSSENLRFRRSAHGRWQIYRASDTKFSKNLASQIEFAFFGQRLLHQGQVAPASIWGPQFADLFHLFNFPSFERRVNGRMQYGLNFGFNELNELRKKNPERLAEIIATGGLLEIDLEPYLDREIYKGEAKLGSFSDWKDLMVREALENSKGYQKAAPGTNPNQLNTGEYLIEGNKLILKLKTYPLPHNLVGITRSGKVVALVISGDKHREIGVAVQDLAKRAREIYREQYGSLADQDPLEELFLLANSKDALRRVVENGNGYYDILSDAHYTGSTAALAISFNPAEARSRMTGLFADEQHRLWGASNAVRSEGFGADSSRDSRTLVEQFADAAHQEFGPSPETRSEVWSIERGEVRNPGLTSAQKLLVMGPRENIFPELLRRDLGEEAFATLVSDFFNRSELRTQKAAPVLSPVTIHWKDLFPGSVRPQIVVVSDNSGTLVVNSERPMESDMLERVLKLLAVPDNFLLLNSGDPVVHMTEHSQRELFAKSEGSARNQIFAIGNGGANEVHLKDSGEVLVAARVKSWPVERQLEYARKMIHLYFAQLKKREGKLTGVLSGISDTDLDQIEKDAMDRLSQIETNGSWGKERVHEVYEFPLFNQALSKQLHFPADELGYVHLYDSGPKQTLYAKDTKGLSPYPPQFFQTIAATIETQYSGDTRQLRVSFGNIVNGGFVDLTEITKAEGVMNVFHEKIKPQLDLTRPVLIVVLGDGGNDIPTYHLNFGIPGVVMLKVFLSHDELYASMLPNGSYVGRKRLEGTADTLDFLNQATRDPGSNPELHLFEWKSESGARSELRRVDTPHLNRYLDPETMQRQIQLVGMSSEKVKPEELAAIFWAAQKNPNFRYTHYVTTKQEASELQREIQKLSETKFGISPKRVSGFQIRVMASRAEEIPKMLRRGETMGLIASAQVIREVRSKKGLVRIVRNSAEHYDLLVLSAVKLLQSETDMTAIYQEDQVIARNQASEKLAAELSALHEFLSAA